MKRPASASNQFGLLFLEVRPRLAKLVSGYLRRRQDVEDVIQETFVRSYQSWINQRIEQPEHYLFRTARNLSLKHLGLSANKITDSIEDLDLLEVLGTGDVVLKQLESDERFALFCEATRSLPAQCRKVFILKKAYDLSHEEIAARLGITVSTSNQHLAKALARVTACLREQGYLEDVSR